MSQSSPLPISVFIVTLNEAKHLAEVLAPLQAFDEVIVVDSGSTDETVSIAESSGARVIYNPWPGFARQKQFAMEQCRNEWVLNIDGDEVLPQALVEELATLVNSGGCDAVRFFFEDIFWQKNMHASSDKRSIIRCFKKSKARYPVDRKVHENIVLDAGSKVVNSQHRVKHYGYGSTHILMEKQNKYSLLKAQEKFEKRKKPSILKLLLVFPLTFLKFYLFKKMCLSGRRGLVHAMIEAQYAFLKEAKLNELWFVSRK